MLARGILQLSRQFASRQPQILLRQNGIAKFVRPLILRPTLMLGFHSFSRLYTTQEPKRLDKENKPSTNNDPEPKAVPKSNLIKEARRLFGLARPEGATLLAAFLCLIATSAVSMLLPLLIGKIIDSAKDKSKIAEEKAATGDDSEEDDEVKILGLAPLPFYSGLLVIFVAGATANFGRIYLLRVVGEKMVARLRSRLFAKIMSQDSYFFDIGPSKTGMKTGDLISRLSSDSQIISKSLSGNLSDGARSLISGTVGLSMMFWVSWKLTLYMGLLFPPLIFMSLVYGKRIKRLSRTIQDNLGSFAKVLEEKLNALKTIQSFSQQRAVIHDFNDEVRQIVKTSISEGKLSGVFYGINGFLGNAAIVGLLSVGSNLVGSGEITIGDLSTYMMYAIYTGSSVYGLNNFHTELMKGIGASERVFEIMDLEPLISTNIGSKVKNLSGDVEFRNISFRYPSRLDSPIFTNFNLHVKKGEHVCLVGPSGSGKSTVSQLLLRFYDPEQGEVLVNGENIKDMNLNSYRSAIGYVQQEPVLFSGTIRDNIVFGRPDSTDEEVELAAKLSNSFSFIDTFPEKLNTLVGPLSSDRAQLSGGQKQRLSLARTLIKKPHLLILDEATSALDSQLEKIVMQNLSLLAKESDLTIVLIAHRLTTIQNSERIIVLDNKGQIVEDGAFEELLQNPNSELNKLLKTGEFEDN
ncbi:hypothetical protein PUMCH_003303 [Australozyma saopauloensis]|uniref:ATP-dependent permease MDL1 n=1 Tax=Australozyma saopauloensis TaxID=291208 RepID=A0AAX4HBU0_9ASCO|nr:hypothetical protein PUMCH_003303 [[Candida] saopauloensis]